jgi:hypothetical protein
MPADRSTASPVAELATVSGWRARRVTACFDCLDSDDTSRIGRGLEALAALLDAGAPEVLVAAEFRRRGLGEAALDVRMAVIRSRQRE